MFSYLLFFARPKKSNKRKDALSRGISSHAHAREEPSPKLRVAPTQWPTPMLLCSEAFVPYPSERSGTAQWPFPDNGQRRLDLSKRERPRRLVRWPIQGSVENPGVSSRDLEIKSCLSLNRYIGLISDPCIYGK